MRESVFNSEIVKSIKEAGYWAYKIADSPASWTSHVTRFTPDKPADIIANIRGRFVLIESKQFKQWKGLYIREFRDYQIKNLDETVRQKGKAYAFINIRIKKTAKDEYANWCVILNWKKYGPIIKETGINAKEMRAMTHGIWIRGYKGLFDLREQI